MLRRLALPILAAALFAQVVPSDADRILAKSLVAMSQTDAQQAIAAADSSTITPGLSQALKLLGNDRFNASDSVGALRIYHLAVDVAVRGGFTRLEADGRINLSIPMTRLGLLEDSLRECHAADDLYKKVGSPPEPIGVALNTCAIVHKELGELTASLEESRAAEKIFRQTGNEARRAQALSNIGNTFEKMGNYRAALEAFEESVHIAEQQKILLGQAFGLNNIAAVYVDQGDYALAADYAARSLKIKETLGGKEDIATSLLNLALIYRHAGKNREAVASLQRAAQLAHETGRKSVEAEALCEWGDMERNLDRVRQALELYAAASEKVMEARALGRMARILLTKHDYAGAIDAANKARTMAQERGATPEHLFASLIAGQSYRATGKNHEAREALEEAVSLTERARDQVAGGAMSRQAFLAERTAPYREMVALEIREGHFQAALRMAERAKGRMLLDLLTRGSDRTFDSREQELRRRIASLKAQGATRELEKARLNQAEFYAAHPEIGVRRGEIPIASFEQISALVPKNGAILEYAVTPDGIAIFLIGKTLEVHIVSVRGIAELREKLAARDPAFLDASLRSYKALIGQNMASVSAKSTLIIVPDGDLWQIPFAALRSPEGRFLIEDAAISYAPSLSVLRALRSAKTRAAESRLAAFGNPGGDNPEAEREVKTLANLYGAGNSKVWLRGEATNDAFRNSAAGYEVVHVAAHGIFDDRNPLGSHILFSGGTHVDADDIREMELKAKLVILSGCETARGRFSDGEGAIGMSWAFLVAGSKAVVASQWRVESSSTTELMLRFHRAMLGGTGKSQALRQAAIEMMKEDRFHHPFYWAGFGLFGDGS